MSSDPASGDGVRAVEPKPAEGRRARRAWWGRTYSPEEIDAAKQQWRELRPWSSPMAQADKVLIGVLVAAVVLSAASLPLRPFLLASHPVATAAVTGSTSAVGAGAAFARIGQVDLWVVIIAGIVGKIKFDWLYWWAGRRWGAKGVRFLAANERAQRFVDRAQSWPAGGTFLLVVGASVPGVPAIAAYLLAGLTGMSLPAFILADVIGAGIMTGLVAGLGYALGQQAVDVVLLVDHYALWITLAFAVVIAVQATRAQLARQKAPRAVT